MSNQQKDNPASGGQGLRAKDHDDTGGPRGDQLSNAVGAAAGGTGLGEAASADDARTGTIAPPTSKGGASSA